MQILTRTQRCVRMVKMQGAEDEGAGSVLKYMTKPEDDSNAADWLLWHTAIELEEFVSLGFSHHIEILSKVKDVEERLFYIHQACINHWNKYYNPMGVATYKTAEDVKKVLPSEEDLRRVMDNDFEK